MDESLFSENSEKIIAPHYAAPKIKSEEEILKTNENAKEGDYQFLENLSNNPSCGLLYPELMKDAANTGRLSITSALVEKEKCELTNETAEIFETCSDFSREDGGLLREIKIGNHS